MNQPSRPSRKPRSPFQGGRAASAKGTAPGRSRRVNPEEQRAGASQDLSDATGFSQEQAQHDDLFAEVVSGAFDGAENAADQQEDTDQPAKRVLQPQPDAPKLHKVLAQAGLGSRLEMERYITEGRISVNQEPAHVGQRIQYGDVIRLDGRILRVRIAPPLPRVIAYHKPVGEVVTHDDPQNRPTVFRTLPRLAHGKWQSVGRLDLNTEGLLLITSSGELANQLMHPRFGLQREYAVRVLGALSDEEKQRLLDGVQLEDGPAQFGSIEEGGGEGANCWYRVTISEGRNREVRRMFETVGHAVSRLIRIRYGLFALPRGLRRGSWMELGERDVRALMEAAGMQESKRIEQVRRQEQNTQNIRRRSPDRAVSARKRHQQEHLPLARGRQAEAGGDQPPAQREERASGGNRSGSRRAAPGASRKDAGRGAPGGWLGGKPASGPRGRTTGRGTR